MPNTKFLYITRGKLIAARGIIESIDVGLLENEINNVAVRTLLGVKEEIGDLCEAVDVAASHVSRETPAKDD